jgi:hypothetical protein
VLTAATCAACGGVIVPVGGVGGRRGWLNQPPMIHPNAYVWFVLLSSLDAMLTWVILKLDGEELNAVANAVIEYGGLRGMLLFKFALVIFVVVMCEGVSRRNLRAGTRLAEWSVAITSIPVVLAFVQLIAAA